MKTENNFETTKFSAFNKVVIVGLGLIGGSLGKAMLSKGLALEVWGTDISTPVLIQGLKTGAISHYSLDPVETFAAAELIILAAPVGMIISSLEKILPYIPADALVTDTGSIKEKIVTKAIALSKGHFQFLGGHPMAGSEKKGIFAADSQILPGHTYIFTPHQPIKNYQRATNYFQVIEKLGMHIAFLPADEHDRIIANLSHLPHLIAATLMTAVGSKCAPAEMQTFTGNGLKDTTRISAGAPDLWTQILSMNRANIINGLEKFQNALKIVKTALQENDTPSLHAFLSHASAMRSRLATEEEKKDE